jgi:uncharacterized protein (TIGR03067 family)
MRLAVATTWAIGLLLAGSGLLSAAGPSHEECVRNELKRLEGSWKLLSTVVDGKPLTLEESGEPTAVIAGTTMTTGKDLTALISVEPPTTVPGAGGIELVIVRGPVKGQVLKGVYRLADDMLTLCYGDAQSRAEEVFKAHDRNGDGLLNAAEMPERLRGELAKWDSNGDGFIDFAEFRAYVRSRAQEALHDLTSRPDSGMTVMVYGRQPGSGAGPGSAAAPSHHSGPRWEYRTLTRQELINLAQKDVTAGLNKLGEDGWELVAIRPGVGSGSQRGPGRPDEANTEYYFKRPVSAAGTGPAPKAAAPAAPSGEGEFVVFRLKHGSAPALVKVLEAMMNGDDGPRRLRIVADPATNQLLVRGRANDLATVEAILNKLDVPSDNAKAAPPAGPGEGDFKIFPLKNASAIALAKVLDELLNGDAGAKRIRVVADPVTNQLLVRGREDDVVTIAKLLQQLDVPAENEGSGTPPKPGGRPKNPKP